MDILTRVLNKVAGTIVDGVPTLTATVAANRLAGTSGLSLVGALNRLVGTSGRDLAYVVNQLGGSSGLDVNGAALYYESLPSRLLPTATFWVDAVDSGGGQTVTNLGSGGSALNGQLGSTTSADSNDPAWLEHTGTNYVYLPGVNSNYLSVPDSSALDITGDLDLRVWCALDDWTPTAIQILIGKRETNQIAYQMAIDTTGNVRLLWSTNGTAGILATSTVATGVADGSAKWIRATLDVDNGASGYSVQFFTSDNGTSWTQLGTTVTVAGVTSVFASTANLNIGARNSGAAEPAAGKFYRAQVRNGINGTLVCDVDTSVITSGSATSFTEKSSNAATVTINRGSSGRKSVAVTRTVWLLGTDDYMQVADNNLLDFASGEAMTMMVVSRQFSTFPAAGVLMSKRTNNVAGDVGYNLRNGVGTPTNLVAQIVDSSTEAAEQIARTAGQLHVAFGVRGSSRMTAYMNGTAGSGVTDSTGSLANANPLRLGRHASITDYIHYELMAAAVFRRALTMAEIDSLTAYYRDRYL